MTEFATSSITISQPHPQGSTVKNTQLEQLFLMHFCIMLKLPQSSMVLPRIAGVMPFYQPNLS
jgi:hypothetical protein